MVVSLDVSFTRHAAGRTYVAEAAATNDFGFVDAFAPAGILTVLPSGEGDDDEEDD